jgi:hypothetical protein
MLVLFLIFAAAGFSQSVILRPAAALPLPTHIDGNSPAFWIGEDLHLFSSTGDPEMISVAKSLDGPWQSQRVDVSRHQHFPLWVEAAWRDEDGTVLGWYHHEPGGICSGNSLSVPKIGAVISYDGGRSIEDLGIVLESGDAADCNARNGFFAGGHGDFSVVLDRERQYFYFFFTNYGGVVSEQGVVTARLAFEDRFRPAGAVHKYYRGAWTERGIGGRTTPIYPASRSWQSGDTDSFWGPAVQWNTYLEKYVMFLNRSCCKPGWPQEGIYAAFSGDLSEPRSWTARQRLLDGESLPTQPGYYPQVMGLEPGETDTLVGRFARLFVHGVSNWEAEFSTDPPPEPDPKNPEQPVTTVGIEQQ